MAELEQWLTLYSAALVFIGALLAHLLIPIPSELHPINLWNQLAKVLASKVGGGDEPSQQRLAGTLAWSLLIVPCAALFFATRNLVWQPYVFDFTLLFFALGWREQELFARQSGKLLSAQDKTQLRELLDSKLNRDCSSLSILGLGKACSETLIVGQMRTVAGVIFWYAVGGPIAAALFRLCGELARSWSIHVKYNGQFGLFANRVFSVMEWLPSKLFTALLLMNKRSLTSVSSIRQQALSWRNKATGLALASIGVQHELALGGPAIYSGSKIERAKLGGRIAPAALHLGQIAQTVRIRLYVLVAVILLLLVLSSGSI